MLVFAILDTGVSVWAGNLRVVEVNFGGKTNCVVRPVTKVPIARMVENH